MFANEGTFSGSERNILQCFRRSSCWECWERTGTRMLPRGKQSEASPGKRSGESFPVPEPIGGTNDFLRAVRAAGSPANPESSTRLAVRPNGGNRSPEFATRRGIPWGNGSVESAKQPDSRGRLLIASQECTP